MYYYYMVFEYDFISNTKYLFLKFLLLHLTYIEDTEYFDFSKCVKNWRDFTFCAKGFMYFSRRKGIKRWHRDKIDFYVIMFDIEQKQSRAGWNQIYMLCIADSFINDLYDSRSLSLNVGEEGLLP